MFPFYENKPDLTYAVQARGMSFPLHLHGLVEMLYLQEGKVRVMVDGKSQVLSPGELAVVFPNQVHGYEDVAPNCCIMLLVPLSALGRSARVIKDKKPRTAFLPAEALPIGMAESFCALTHAQSGYVMDALAQLVFVRALEQLELEPIAGYSETDLDLVSRAVVWIAANYRSPIQLQEAADRLGVSRCYLSRTLGGALGMGFCQYLNCLRVDYAKGLLRTTRMSVLEIAMDSGYENLRTFNRAFKNITGVTPMTYKKQ